MDIEEEFAASLAAGIEQVLSDVLLQAAAGGSGKELYTYLDRSRQYGQQRVWVRARVENGRPVEIECEDRDEAIQAAAHYKEWESWNQITQV